MTRPRHLILCAALAVAATTGYAQTRNAAPPARTAATAPGDQPNAVKGFSENRDQPVHIEATRLEVRDKDKVATFIGNVQFNQGDTEMRCKTLIVYYEPDDGRKDTKAAAKAGAGTKVGDIKTSEPRKTGAAGAAMSGPGGEQRIRRLEARGDVVVTQKEQIATGERALFDMQHNTVTMTGNVVLTQGNNIVRGERLVVDMATGLSRVESGKSGDGRVQGLFLPGAAQKPGAPPGAGGLPFSKPPAGKPPTN